MKHSDQAGPRTIDDAAYVGAIPDHYHRSIGPFLSEPYAQHIALRIKELGARRVLETACGTGIVTRRLREVLPDDALLVASDLNPPMLAIARRTVGERACVEWAQADMAKLHFTDHTFDAVVCQFGLMFVRDKLAAVREARRVLQPGGSFLLTTWATLDRNPIIGVAHRAIVGLFPDDPPQYLQRAAFGYGDRNAVAGLLDQAGFRDVEVHLVAKTSVARSAQELAAGLVEGHPLVDEIRLRDAACVPAVVDAVARAIARQFGEHPVKTRIAALIASGVA